MKKIACLAAAMVVLQAIPASAEYQPYAQNDRWEVFSNSTRYDQNQYCVMQSVMGMESEYMIEILMYAEGSDLPTQIIVNDFEMLLWDATGPGGVFEYTVDGNAPLQLLTRFDGPEVAFSEGVPYDYLSQIAAGNTLYIDYLADGEVELEMSLDQSASAIEALVDCSQDVARR